MLGDRYSSMSGEQQSLAKTTLGDTQNQKLDAYGEQSHSEVQATKFTSATKSAAGHPPVWTDVTSAHISKLHMACKEHIMFTYKVVGAHAANLPYPETQRNKNLLKPMAELMKYACRLIPIDHSCCAVGSPQTGLFVLKRA